MTMTKGEFEFCAAMRRQTFSRADSTAFWLSEDLQDELYFEDDGKVVNELLKNYGNDYLDKEDLKQTAELYVGLQLIYQEVKKDYESGKFIVK